MFISDSPIRIYIIRGSHEVIRAVILEDSPTDARWPTAPTCMAEFSSETPEKTPGTVNPADYLSDFLLRRLPKSERAAAD